ncbi:tRNA (adenosine(37)-N6)-threonylcarbamoyltransferase complex dimerization subunit type 1 TsaB [bacterium]|nr:tRNA (adenosine(37)-N6)-threonylcarbamoyltransferase complex dimerization subunit type 1 TsaB [bacterium]
MITLAFDTCLDKMYVVLKKDGKISASKIIENHDNKYHSAFLISTLQEVLSENSIKPNDIDLIGVNIGPGSFTGIRACVTVARVMAQQLNCKTVGVSSLEILAKAEDQRSGCQEGRLFNDSNLSETLQKQQTDNSYTSIPLYIQTSLVALDARKNCAYLFHDGEIKGAVDLEKVKEVIATGKYNVITDDKLQPILGGKSYQKENLPLGEILAKLAEEKVSDGDWHKLKPLYIQPPPMG